MTQVQRGSAARTPKFGLGRRLSALLRHLCFGSRLDVSRYTTMIRNYIFIRNISLSLTFLTMTVAMPSQVARECCTHLNGTRHHMIRDVYTVFSFTFKFSF